MASEPNSSLFDEMGPISGINITPFVDVVLVLLVIFIATAPLLVKDSIGLNLPKAQNGDQKSAQSLGIVITRQGQILIDGQLANPNLVKEQVARSLQAHPNIQALISADQDAKHGDVIRAIDLIKSAGLNRFAIQIEKPQN